MIDYFLVGKLPLVCSNFLTRTYPRKYAMYFFLFFFFFFFFFGKSV